MTRRTSSARPAALRRKPAQPRRMTPLRLLARDRSTAQGWGRATGAALWVVFLGTLLTLSFFWGILLGIAEGVQCLRRALARERAGPPVESAADPDFAAPCALPPPLDRKRLPEPTARTLLSAHHRR